MRVLPATALMLGALGAAVGCGAQEHEAPAALPPSGTAYRSSTTPTGSPSPRAAATGRRPGPTAPPRRRSDGWIRARSGTNSTRRSR